MNTTIEQALAAWLATIPAFAGITIHPGQSDDEIPNDLVMIYVVCGNTESPANRLYVASVQIVVTTPECTGSLENHKSLVANLKTALGDAEEIANYFPSATPCKGASINFWTDSQDSGRWTTAADLTLGVVDI